MGFATEFFGNDPSLVPFFLQSDRKPWQTVTAVGATAFCRAVVNVYIMSFVACVLLWDRAPALFALTCGVVL